MLYIHTTYATRLQKLATGRSRTGDKLKSTTKALLEENYNS